MATYAERVAAGKKHAAETRKKHLAAKAAKKKAKAAKRLAKEKARNVKKINKMALRAEKKEKGGAGKSVTLGKGSRLEKLSPTGKIRGGAKGVELTEGGAYAKYGEKTESAKQFRDAFAKASKEGKKTFTWDGRSYTTKKAQFGGRVVGPGMPIPRGRRPVAPVAPPAAGILGPPPIPRPPVYKKGGKVKANNPYGWPTKDTGNGGK